MKKIFVIITVLMVLVLTSGIASARHFWFGPRFFIGPPVVVPPPAYYSYPYGGYPPPGYSGLRTWVPGHWESVWTDHGWERYWDPGHWEYRR
jgi:hypothetical protein